MYCQGPVKGPLAPVLFYRVAELLASSINPFIFQHICRPVPLPFQTAGTCKISGQTIKLIYLSPHIFSIASDARECKLKQRSGAPEECTYQLFLLFRLPPCPSQPVLSAPSSSGSKASPGVLMCFCWWKCQQNTDETDSGKARKI